MGNQRDQNAKIDCLILERVSLNFLAGVPIRHCYATANDPAANEAHCDANLAPLDPHNPSYMHHPLTPGYSFL